MLACYVVLYQVVFLRICGSSRNPESGQSLQSFINTPVVCNSLLPRSTDNLCCAHHFVGEIALILLPFHGLQILESLSTKMHNQTMSSLILVNLLPALPRMLLLPSEVFECCVNAVFYIPLAPWSHLVWIPLQAVALGYHCYCEMKTSLFCVCSASVERRNEQQIGLQTLSVPIVVGAILATPVESSEMPVWRLRSPREGCLFVVVR